MGTAAASYLVCLIKNQHTLVILQRQMDPRQSSTRTRPRRVHLRHAQQIEVARRRSTWMCADRRVDGVKLRCLEVGLLKERQYSKSCGASQQTHQNYAGTGCLADMEMEASPYITSDALDGGGETF
jgi:hypothetical protein